MAASLDEAVRGAVHEGSRRPSGALEEEEGDAASAGASTREGQARQGQLLRSNFSVGRFLPSFLPFREG